MQSFRETPFETRKAMAASIRQRHPDRVPVICDRSPNFDVNFIKDAKIKFLVPEEMTLGAFQRVIRRQLYLEPSAALFVFCDERLCEAATTMYTLFERHRDDDGFLYLMYCGENAFGRA